MEEEKSPPETDTEVTKLLENISVVENKEMSDEQPSVTMNLIPLKNARSKVWTYFGFQPDEFGEIEDRERPVCRLCGKRVVCCEGSTSNMFMHLLRIHPEHYNLVNDKDKKIGKKQFNINMSDDDKESVVLIMKRGAKSAVWQYFGYRVDENGKLADRNYPTCVLCKADVISTGGSTGNMRQHLRIHHIKQYHRCIDIQPAKPMQNIEFDEIPQSDLDAGIKPYQLYERLSKKSGCKSLVWSFFGYPRKKGKAGLNPDTPVCLLCDVNCEAYNGDDSKLLAHLKEHHESEFNRIPKEMTRSLKEITDFIKSSAKNTTKSSTTTTRSILMKKNAKSPIWMFFGFQPNADGKPDSDNPICIICKKNCTCGSTIYLFSHLKRDHPAEYAICMEAGKETNQSAICMEAGKETNQSICQDEAELSEQSHDESHDQEEKPLSEKSHDNEEKPFIDQSSHQEESSSINKTASDGTVLLSKCNPKSAVWQYFGYLSQDSDRFKPTCQVCSKEVLAPASCTTNLWKHLQIYHKEEFNKVLQSQKASSIKFKTLEQNLPVFKNKKTNQKLSVEDQKLSVKERKLTVEEQTILLEKVLSGGLLARSNAKSAVWQYYGFRPDPLNPSEPVDTNIPTCRLCQKDVTAHGDTSNMFRHLRLFHKEEHTICIEASKKALSNNSKDDTCSSQSQEDNRQPVSPSGEETSEDSEQTSGQSAEEHSTCCVCDKTLSAEEIITPVQDEDTPGESENNRLTYCMECFITLLEDVSPDGNDEHEQYDTIEFELVEVNEDGTVEQNDEGMRTEKSEEVTKKKKEGKGKRKKRVKSAEGTKKKKEMRKEEQDCSKRKGSERKRKCPAWLTNYSSEDCAGVPSPTSSSKTKKTSQDVFQEGAGVPSPISSSKTNKSSQDVSQEGSKTSQDVSQEGTSMPSPAINLKATRTHWKYLPLDKITGKSLVLIFFAYPHARNDNETGAVCLICKKAVKESETDDKDDENTTNLLHHLKDDHPPQYSLCNDIISGTCPEKYVLKNDTVQPAWLFFGFVADTYGEPKSLNRPVCLLCKDMIKGPNSPYLYNHLETSHPVEAELCMVMRGAHFTNQYTHCWDTVRYGTLDVTRQSCKRATCQSAEAITISIHMSPANIKKPSMEKIYACHRCEKEIAFIETMNKAKAGAHVPSGEIDYDYCWDCFVIVKEIGVMQDGQESVLDEPIIKITECPCKICGKIFDTRISCRRHNNLAHREDKYICSFCSKEFQYRASLMRHEVVMHKCTNGSFIKCDICEKVLKDRYSLERHMRSHTGQKPYICHICGKSFTESGSVALHMEKVHHITREKPHVCTICGRGFFRKGTLENHMKMHTYASGSFTKCNICEKDLQDRCSLKRHMMTHSGERPYLCQICGKSFNQKGSVDLHMENVHRITNTEDKPYACTICGKGFSQNGSLENHMKMHTNASGSFTTCDICEKDFQDICSLTRHMKTHAREKPYLCRICGKSFTENESVALHMENVHDQKRGKPYVCTICGKSFSQNVTLKYHLKMHGSDSFTKCNICEKVFQDRCSLTRHMRTHTGQKPYLCRICGKSFTQKGSVGLHMEKVHRQKRDKPYPCTICEMGFIQKGSLENHMKKVHDK